MSEKPITVLTWEEHVRQAQQLSAKLLVFLQGETDKPGKMVLAALLLARGLCLSFEKLPDFKWYVTRVEEVVDAFKREVM